MTAMRPPSTLMIATLNPNGLHLRSKRQTLFRLAQQQAAGVGLLLLQETHCPSQEVADAWMGEGVGPGLPWLGQSAWAFGTSASRGVAILVHPSLRPTSFEILTACPEGRFVAALVSLTSHRYIVFSVYAPARGEERPAFFQGPLRDAMRRAVERYPGAELVVGGDFNCIESVTRDQFGGGSSAARTRGYADGLGPLQEEHGLADSYRLRFPAQREFTHQATSGVTAARLDRILVGPTLAPMLQGVGVADGWPGDHRLAWALVLLPHALPKGPGDWVVPPDVLADAPFVERFSARMRAWFQERPLARGYTAADRWDAFKRWARDRIQLHCLEKARVQRREDARRQARAAAVAARWARDPDSPAAAAAWAAVQRELQAHQEAAAARAALFAGVAWEDFGETSTHWFHRLAAQRRADCTIAELRVSAGGGAVGHCVSLASHEGREAAGTCIADFYDGDRADGLFHPHPTCPAAQQLLLRSLDRTISEEHREMCERGVTATDLREALAGCEGGKVPGSDGLTYEFYRAFWDVIGEPLAEVFGEAFATGHLPPSMLLGIIVIVYKGIKAGPRSDVRAYRPLTMLNCDYKLLAKTVSLRFNVPLTTVIDSTQTAFLQGRWIGENVLVHMEEIDYLETTQQPGVIAFLDFEKAYDRISRGWVARCMEGLGFGPNAMLWVHLLFEGTRACCRFNGFHTREFAVRSGVAQGSPLSPALYLIAAQPLAARLRRLQSSGQLPSITLPDGTAAPPSHQHADDITLHVPSLPALRACMTLAVLPWCDASASKANAEKTKALLLGPARVGHQGSYTDLASRVQVVGPEEAVRHLGIMLAPGGAGEAARAAKMEAIRGTVLQRIAHWAARLLSHDGRAHVAQQCLASALVYHATFSRPPAQLLSSMHLAVVRFVEGGDMRFGPCREVAHLPRHLGGRSVPNLPRIVDALQAGVVQRLLHPARHPWKTLLTAQLSRLPVQVAGLRAVFSSLVFASPPAAGRPAGALGARVEGYLQGFHACTPHRLHPPADLPPHHVLSEPLFGNPTIVSQPGCPLTPAAFPLACAAGVRTVAGLGLALRQRPAPPAGAQHELHTLQSFLPPCWCTVVPPPPAPLPQEPYTWWEWPAAAGDSSSGTAASLEVVHVQLGAAAATVYTVSADGALVQPRSTTVPPARARPLGRPCLVIEVPARVASERCSGRPLAPESGAATLGSGGPDHRAAPTIPYYVGPWQHGNHPPFDASQWGLAGVPLLRATQRQRTLVLLQADAAAAAARGKTSARGYVCGGRLPPAVWEDRLEERQRGWVETATLATVGHRRPRADMQAADAEMSANTPWMREVRPRLHPAVRARQRQELEDGQPSAGLSLGTDGISSGGGTPSAGRGGGDAPTDRRLPERRGPPRGRQRGPPPWILTFDDPRGGAPEEVHQPWRGTWARLHRVPAPRQHRFLAWRILHAALPCAARTAAMGSSRNPARVPDGRCHHPGCGQWETLTHVFIECEVAAAVMAWVRRLWSAVSGRPPPPCTPQVLLVGDHCAWDPGGGDPGPSALWHTLRLAALYYLWAQRCHGRDRGRSSAVAVAAQVIHHLRARLRGDAVRAYCHPPDYVVLGGEWLPDRQLLTPAGFQAKWGPPGLLYSGLPPSSLQVSLTLVHPVAPPLAPR
jgi:exonuclease III